MRSLEVEDLEHDWFDFGGVDVEQVLAVVLSHLLQFFHLAHELWKHLGRAIVHVLRLQVVLQQHQVLVLDVGHEFARDHVRAFRREESDDDEHDDDGRVVLDDRTNRLAVLDVVVMETIEAGCILEDFRGNLPTWGHPQVAHVVVGGDAAQEEEVDPTSLEDADLTLLRKTHELLETLGELDDAKNRDARLVHQLVERWIRLKQTREVKSSYLNL